MDSRPQQVSIGNLLTTNDSGGESPGSQNQSRRAKTDGKDVQHWLLTSSAFFLHFSVPP
jgi:hypothetical protein